ncbi:MAG TPA: hypothetical protein VLI69_01840 [Gammaproteobacteria bacterium]|nr:hypothetical protein [Gammaproteobacteria bacterium]
MSICMLHYHDQRGFVILVVLIFMQILILLNWYAMENIFLMKKFVKNSIQHDELYDQGKYILSELESDIVLNLPGCMVPFTESGELTERSLEEWEFSNACSGNYQGSKYFYVVESMGVDYCALVENVKAAEYFRITLFLLSRQDNKVFLQSTIIRPNENVMTQPCKGVSHFVEAGRQSMRELNF